MKLKKFIGVSLSCIMAVMNLNIVFSDNGTQPNAEYDNVDYVYDTGSANSANKYVSVKEGEFNDDICFIIRPTNEVIMSSEIIFNLENGKFDENINWDSYAYHLGTNENYTYDYFFNEYQRAISGSSEEAAFRNVFENPMSNARSVELPYKLEKLSDTQLKVTLFPISDSYVDQKFADVNKPFYKIPIPFTATGGGNVKVKINSEGTSISNGMYTIAETEGSGEEYTFSEGSRNSVSRQIILKENDFNDEQFIKIQPLNEVELDSEIIFTLENGKFDVDDMERNTSGAGLDYYQY